MLKLLKLSTSIVKIVLKTKMCVCVCVCVCERVHVVDALSFHHQKWQNGVEDMMKSTEFLVFFPVCPPPPCDVQVLHTFLFKASHPRPTPPPTPQFSLHADVPVSGGVRKEQGENKDKNKNKKNED